MIDNMAKKVKRQKNTAENPYEFSKYSREIIREVISSKNTGPQIKNSSTLQVLAFDIKTKEYLKFKYFFRRSKLTKFPFVYAKLRISIFSPFDVNSITEIKKNMLKHNAYTLIISQIFEHRLNLLA